MKVIGGKIAHQGVVEEGSVTVGDIACAEIDKNTEWLPQETTPQPICCKKALRTVLGTHVEQSGSYVSADRLRFDFTHFTAMTPDEIKEVERLVNEAIFASYPIVAEEMSIDAAREKGAMALFGEKYGGYRARG